MVRHITPWGHTNKSWTVNEVIHASGSGGASGYKRLKLLIWKNYKLQTRNKLQTLVELLFPLVFIAILVIVRIILPSTLVSEPTIYQPLEIDGIPSYIIREKCNRIYYAPSNEATDALIQRVKSDYFDAVGLKYNFTGFATEDELLDVYKLTKVDNGSQISSETETSSPVLAGIVFENEFIDASFPKHIKYKLRFPASQRSEFDAISEKFGLKAAWFTELIYPLFQLLGPRAKDSVGGGLPGYQEEGFLYVQFALERTLTRMLLKDKEDEYNKYDIKLEGFPYPAYIDDKYLFGLQAFLPLLLILSMIFPVLNTTKCIVHEKEKRLKESMKMMGLSNWIHWTAWILKSQIVLMISSVIIAFLLKAKFLESQTLAVIPETDITVLIVILFVYSFSAVCFCCLISTLFSRANTAALGAGALWFFLYVPYCFIQPRYNSLSRTFKIVCSIMTNNPIGFVSQIICNFEGIGVGVQWANILEGSTPDDNFCIADCILLLAVNSIIFLLIAFYIETVWPGEYGIPLPWNFFLKKWYWTGKFRIESESDFSRKEESERDTYFEPDPPRKRAGIEIKNLTKTFGSKTAVHRMNLNMFQDQVTALLGHNGAGKSTTMSMLTGLFPPTSGTAVINGFDLCNDIKSVRGSLGICPQHDVLFDELTVEEHLRFFCELKGLDKRYVNREVTRMIEALGLKDKRHAEARALSGGMKRKLSVGIAFCGGSKFVLLDEPTSGMDPGARRSTWDLIQSEKKGRTVLLSTHFMEEADLLGDRIAIMSQGELHCCGSSLFLKKKYGGGYHLVIVKTPECMVQNISNVLKSAIPEVEVDQDIGAELSYILPDSKSHLFPTLFSELERKRKDLGIASYGASITTMENVFMRVIREAEEAEFSDVMDHSKEVKLRITTLNNTNKYSNRNTGLVLLIQQLWGMLMKKLIFLVRNRSLVLASLSLPISYIVVIFCIMNAFPGFSNPTSLLLSLSSYETVGRTTTAVNCPSQDEICKSYRDVVSQKYNVVDIPANSTFNDFILDKASNDLAIVNFQYIVGLEYRVPSANTTSLTNKTELIAFFNNQPFHAPPLTLNIVTNAFLRQANYSVDIKNHPFPYSRLDSLKEQGGILTVGFQVGYNCAMAMSFLAAYFVLFPIRERVSGSKHLQYISGVKPFIFWTTSFVTDIVQYMLPCLGIVVVFVLFKMEEFTTLPMQIYFLILCASFGVTVILLVYVLSFLFVIPTSGFAVLTVMGIFTGVAPMFAVSLIQNPEFQMEALADEMNKYLLVFPNYALGMGIVQFSTNYHLTKSCAQNFNLEFLCSAYPESVCCNKLRENYLDWERSGIGRNLVYLLASAVVYALLLILAELNIFRAVGKCFSRKNRNSNEDENINEEDTIEDSDVIAEREKIKTGSLSTLCSNNTLIVQNLTKYYDNFLAVDDLNLGVQPGECFGLLGINGAGKSTTFKMLTDDYEPSGGDAYIGGYSIRNQLKKAHQQLGYCPQFDALIGEMTGRETIKMFARLRGIREKDVNSLVDELSDRLLFTPHIDKQVDNYSFVDGGNKRKLSTAVALIGNPPIVFLDEPTTGMDPVARRHLWDAITGIRNQGTSIVLTSHSMEECEALCTRLVIMVNGQFRCLGSTQHLKTKFGKGYTIIAQTAAKVADPNQPFTRSQQEQGRRRSSRSLKRSKSTNEHYWETELQDLRSFIEERFPPCTLKDIHPCFVHYHIHPDENVTWGELFSTMEVAKLRFNLEAYSVGQTSLEQVFLNFTKAQINTS